MQYRKVLGAVVLGALAGIATPWTARGALVVTEALSTTLHPGGTNNADWWELTNTGPIAINLTSYTWNDSGGGPTGPGVEGFGAITSIGVGESIVISEESTGATATAAFRADWGLPVSVQTVNLATTLAPGLSSSGDGIKVYDGLNALVASVSFGASTAGRTFEWDTNGASLGLSVAGENGAYLAPGNGAGGAGLDVGSPGISVPEPSALALAAGLVALNARRRRSA